MMLNDYVRVAQDFAPYAFYASTRMNCFAVTNAAENPQTTMRLNAENGAKFYKKVCFIIVATVKKLLVPT